MINRRFLIVSLASCGALLVAACGTTSNNSPTSPISVGITGPFSGPYADPGSAIRNAGQLAIDDINGAGGINGRKLQALPEDDTCDAQTGVQAAQKLLNESIVAIVGGNSSGAPHPASHTPHRHRDLPLLHADNRQPAVNRHGVPPLV